SEVERTTLHGSEFETPSSYSLQSPQSAPVWAEIQGKGLQQACVGKVANFEIGGAGSLKREDIDAKILCKYTKTSIMKEIPCQILETGRGTFVCEYIPTEVGTHRIELCLNGQKVKGSPFLVSAYSPNKVTIEPIPGGAVGRPVQFIVDASEAGKGQLEISINQGRVRNNVQMQGSGRCLVTFIPEYSGTYIIDVTFNGDLVLGCPVRVEIFDDNAPGGTSQQRFYTSTARESPIPASGSLPYPNFAAQDLSKPLSSSYTYERKEYSSSGGLAGDNHKPAGYRSTVETTTKRHDEDSFDRTIPIISSAKHSTPPKESSTTHYMYERGSSGGGIGDITRDRSLAETEGSKLMYEGVDSFRKEFSPVPPVPSTKHHRMTGLSSLGTPPSTPAEETSLPSSFKLKN
uniref:Uncharacterized protein n=1 Tax=Romanomermis culicivorax TaxID=13658 RepID=A0A915IRF0_ROMCU